jgi:hypothetical protein
MVQETHGLIGAEALRHRVPGLTRRIAATIKRDTCRVLERERRSGVQRVILAAPGVLRGFDSMEICGPTQRHHALIAADGCVPFRTSWTLASRYDSGTVAKLLERDFDTFGPPLVLRLDRAAVHDAPLVRRLLASARVLALHGPPHCPRFYGQLERQNREHREWMATTSGPLDLDGMMSVLNTRPRGTLAWRSADELWRMRSRIDLDRQALAEDVNARAARLRQQLRPGHGSQDIAWRLAVTQALVDRRLLKLEKGGWC